MRSAAAAAFLVLVATSAAAAPGPEPAVPSPSAVLEGRWFVEAAGGVEALTAGTGGDFVVVPGLALGVGKWLEGPYAVTLRGEAALNAEILGDLASPSAMHFVDVSPRLEAWWRSGPIVGLSGGPALAHLAYNDGQETYGATLLGVNVSASLATVFAEQHQLAVTADVGLYWWHHFDSYVVPTIALRVAYRFTL